MHFRSSSVRRITTLAALVFVAVFAVPAHATEKILHNFNPSAKDGSSPNPSLIMDSAGNLYGTTFAGGANFVGTAFKLTPNGSGGWTEQILHNFGASTNDGTYPQGGLVMDSAGNLYGTTNTGGGKNQGVVFELSPKTTGGWSYRVLHSFGNGTDGQGPQDSLVLDSAGSLYGTAMLGGAFQAGIVFQLTPVTGGGWTYAILHQFGNSSDGKYPRGNLTFDGSGNLYGTTEEGGTFNDGTIFELLPSSGGAWTEAILHECDFNFVDGWGSNAGVVFGPGGNIYATMNQGGSLNEGAVIEMTPNGGGGWNESVIYNFGEAGDGYAPFAVNPTFDSAGNLYGTAQQGPGTTFFGIAFELSPDGSGGWTETQLHVFGHGKDGAYAQGSLLRDASGNLYGITIQGGAFGQGTVFELTP